MSAEHKLVDEHDIGLRLWIDEATRGLGPEESKRIREETTEHFLAALEELRADGMTEGAVRVAALERLGGSFAANVEFQTAYFSNASNRRIGTPKMRRWISPIVTLYVILVVWLRYGMDLPSVPTAVSVALGAVLVTTWLASFAARYSYAWWFRFTIAGVLALAGLFLADGFQFTTLVIVAYMIGYLVKISRRMNPDRIVRG